MFKLFYAPGSCALATHIVLEEIGTPYELMRVDLAGGEQRKPEYLAINPKGRVPALATEQGILNETPALLVFLAQRFPHAKLAPLDDLFALARLQAFNSYLCSTVHVARAHLRRGARWADDEAAIAAMKRKAPQNVLDCFALMEASMFVGPWVMGESYSVADPYLFTITRWLVLDGGNLSAFPAIQNHFERMSQRPAVTRAIEQES
jgi:glutathione S-transferase